MTTSNMRSNSSWGDEMADKPDNVLRIYAMNVNGFTLDRRGGQFDQFCSIVKEVQADIICGQEHNLDTSKSVVRSIIHQTAQQHWQRNRINFASTPLTFENIYKPGGTFIFSVGDMTSRLRDRHQDKWGRWTSQTFQGRGGRVLTVISAYQVVTDTPAKGTTTAAAQQHSLLLQAGDSLLSPRLAFKRDLKDYIQQCMEAQQEVVLLGDFNECLATDPDGISKLVIDCGLINVMARLHAQPLPATYARGHRCLDYVFVTEHVATALNYAGYEAFNARFPTDHRSYYVDLDIPKLFGIQIQPLAKYEPRVLESSNVNQVTAFIERKYELLTHHNVFERVKRLNTPGNRHTLAERIDKDVTTASLAAEQHIPRYAKPQWSVVLAKARKKEQVLKKIMSMIKTRLMNEEIIQQEWSDCVLECNPPTYLGECKSMLKATKKEIADIVKESYQRREQERKQRIESLMNSIKASDPQHATRLRQLQKAEAINNLFRKLRSLKQIAQKTGVTRIEIPSPADDDPKTCTTWVQIDIPEEVLYHLQRRNQRHFGQAAGTPFTIHPLKTHLGFDGQSELAKDILNGSYEYSGTNDNVRLLLKHLKQNKDIEEMNVQATISEEEFRGKLKAWRESTTTSPSGLHLGHYKSLIARHKYSTIPEDEDDTHKHERERLNRMQQELLDVHLALVNYALSRGYSYQRWQKVANTILFKDPGSIKIHRTRVIHLYEADYNLAMGLKWRAAIYQAEKRNLLHNGQFGSRPRRNAIDPVFLEEMQFEISRLTRKTLAQTNYDATACYDRIIPNLAAIASQTFGVAESATATNTRTLQHATYHIRTDLGMAPDGYRHSDEAPIFGTGQGSGNSPAIWCFISSVLYQCYDELASPATYCNPD